MTSLAELEKKLASITGDDTMYDNNNDVETNNNNGQDEVKKNNISRNNNITDKINNMSINSIDNIKNGSQRNGFANGNGSVSSYLSPSSSSLPNPASNSVISPNDCIYMVSATAPPVSHGPVPCA